MITDAQKIEMLQKALRDAMTAIDDLTSAQITKTNKGPATAVFTHGLIRDASHVAAVHAGYSGGFYKIKKALGWLV